MIHNWHDPQNINIHKQFASTFTYDFSHLRWNPVRMVLKIFLKYHN